MILALSPGQLTWKRGELLLVLVELVDHVHHVISNTPGRYTATTWGR